jgi:hypothetical protein
MIVVQIDALSAALNQRAIGLGLENRAGILDPSMFWRSQLF